MSVIIVASAAALPGKREAMLDVFREIVPLVHREHGCEMYAAHLEADGDSIVVIERWATPQDLEAHATGAVTARLMASLDGLVAGPPHLLTLESVPLGDPARGAIPSTVA